jgi:hypothetical protein
MFYFGYKRVSYCTRRRQLGASPACLRRPYLLMLVSQFGGNADIDHAKSSALITVMSRIKAEYNNELFSSRRYQR